MNVTATGYTGTYDAAAHGITVSVEVDPSVDPEYWKELYGFDESAGISWYAIYYSSAEELTVDNFWTAGSIISPTFTDAGTHPVYYFVIALDGQTISGSRDVVINEAEPDVTAPEPVQGLRYTGSPQTLIYPGSAVGGTMDYSLDGVDWSTELPQATDVGSYSVLYRVTGDDNHCDIVPKPVSVAIQKKLEPTVVLESWTYGSPAKTPAFTDGVNEVDSSLVSYSYKAKGAGDWTYSAERPTKAGDYVVRAVVDESHQYKGTYTADFSVAPKPLTATVIANDKTYDGTTDASALAFIYDGVLDGDSVSITGVSCAFEDANAGGLKTVYIDPDSAVITGAGSENYAVTIPDTTVATIEKAWAIVMADDVSITVGEAVPEPLKAHTYTSVTGDELVYTLSCVNDGKIGTYDIAVDLDPKVFPNCNYEVTCVPGKLTIAKANLSVSVEGATAKYDGAEHGVTVTVAPESAGAKVYYSTERELNADNCQIAGSLFNPTPSQITTTTRRTTLSIPGS